MRRSKARRRFHTGRIIRNRQRRARLIFMTGEVGEAGRYATRDPNFGCNPRCLICHWDKLDPSRRARTRREWQNWESEYE